MIIIFVCLERFLWSGLLIFRFNFWSFVFVQLLACIALCCFANLSVVFVCVQPHLMWQSSLWRPIVIGPECISRQSTRCLRQRYSQTYWHEVARCLEAQHYILDCALNCMLYCTCSHVLNIVWRNNLCTITDLLVIYSLSLMMLHW